MFYVCFCDLPSPLKTSCTRKTLKEDFEIVPHTTQE